jgi:hypothetical protein
MPAHAVSLLCCLACCSVRVVKTGRQTARHGTSYSEVIKVGSVSHLTHARALPLVMTHARALPLQHYIQVKVGAARSDRLMLAFMRLELGMHLLVVLGRNVGATCATDADSLGLLSSCTASQEQ